MVSKSLLHFSLLFHEKRQAKKILLGLLNVLSDKRTQTPLLSPPYTPLNFGVPVLRESQSAC